MPSAFIFGSSVVGFMSSSSAPPTFPETLAPLCCRALLILSRPRWRVSASVRTAPAASDGQGCALRGAVASGRWKSMRPCRDKMEDHSIAFENSRTLLGQAYCRRVWSCRSTASTRSGWRRSGVPRNSERGEGLPGGPAEAPTRLGRPPEGNRDPPETHGSAWSI